MGTSKKNLDPFPRKTKSCFPQQGPQKREIGCQRTFSKVLWRSEQRQLEVRPGAPESSSVASNTRLDVNAKPTFIVPFQRKGASGLLGGDRTAHLCGSCLSSTGQI